MKHITVSMRACLLLCWACITAAKTSKSSAHFAGGFSLAPGKIKSLCIDHVKHSLPVPCLAACLEAATRLKHVSLHKQQHLASMQGREKIGLVLAFTDMGFDVVVSDVDTVWLQDPLPFLAEYPEADILVSSDSLVRTVPSACRSPYSPQARNSNSKFVKLHDLAAVRSSRSWA